jgi:hypothetical protein
MEYRNSGARARVSGTLAPSVPPACCKSAVPSDCSKPAPWEKDNHLLARNETVKKLRAPTQLIAGATSHLSAIQPESGTAGASAAYHDYATIYLSRNRFPLFMSCPGSTEHPVDGQASESGADAAG